MCQYSGDGGRPSSASIFVGGFILGGIVVGTLGCVYAPQVWLECLLELDFLLVLCCLWLLSFYGKWLVLDFMGMMPDSFTSRKCLKRHSFNMPEEHSF